MKTIDEIQADSFFSRVDNGELIPISVDDTATSKETTMPTDNKHHVRKKAVRLRRCGSMNSENSQCLRRAHHHGVCCFTPIEIREKWPLLWDALQHKITIVYFDDVVFGYGKGYGKPNDD